MNDIAHWRAQIFTRLLQFVLGLGTLTAIPSIVLAAREGMWSIVAIDSTAIAWLFGIWRLPALSFHARVHNFLAVTFIVGVALMIKVGPISQIYLLAIPVLAALLLGQRTAMALLAATGAAILAVRLSEDGGAKAAIIALNYLFIGTMLTLSSSVLLRHLARSLDELRLTSAAVARLNDMVTITEVIHDPALPNGPAHLRIISVNPAFERRTGYRQEDVIGQNPRLLRGAESELSAVADIEAALAAVRPVRAELINYTKAGEAYWVETDLVPFSDEVGNNTHWVAIERDITERKKSEDDIHRLAFYDVLTALPNRRLLMDRIDKLLSSSERGGTISAVLFIDLDRFKNINDARGHATGDALLRDAAGRLLQMTRKADTVARIGGDEFVVLLAHLAPDLATATHAALRVAGKVRKAFDQPFEIEGQSYHSTASIGVTMLPKAGQTAHDLLREADIAMYRAKADGRNGIAFFESEMQAEVERRLTVERDLAAALEAGELEMHLQPQVDRDGRTVGAEMLMRWRRADGSMVPPVQFIPVAEECGLIVSLGAWALREACRAILAIRAAGMHFPLSVNVSPSQFRQPDFVAQIRAALHDTGAPASLLILEVTESLLIDKLDDAIARMHELAALGIRFSIDDFGTGYSSLAYLKQMPLYELKIDKSFVDDTPGNASASAIVQAILAMARHLGLRVVAEGVETVGQADFLLANGCDSLQGY
ncbi:MAG: EAL domain-containing protein, partial [Pseudomonadota bacterium]